MISFIRRWYRRLVHAPFLDRCIYRILDALTDLYSRVRGYSFPSAMSRRGKLDMLWGIYEKETCSLFRTVVKPGMVVIDIGAHIGYFTLLFSRLVGARGRVYAFEADPTNYALLVKNTRRCGNIIPIKRAVSEKTGMIDFYHCEEKSGSHSVLPNIPLSFRRHKIAVPAVSLDLFLEHTGISRIDVIKMDIEGGESAALRGMERTLQTPGLQLVIEFAPAWIRASGISPEEFLRQLTSYRFEINGITKKGLVPAHATVDGETVALLMGEPQEIPYCKNAFVNLSCVKRPSDSENSKVFLQPDIR